MIQRFKIDPSQANTITGKNGTILKIPANAFIDSNGKMITEKEVEIKLMECYDMK
jgi:hypothetical protein